MNNCALFEGTTTAIENRLPMRGGACNPPPAAEPAWRYSALIMGTGSHHTRRPSGSQMATPGERRVYRGRRAWQPPASSRRRQTPYVHGKPLEEQLEGTRRQEGSAYEGNHPARK